MRKNLLIVILSIFGIAGLPAQKVKYVRTVQPKGYVYVPASTISLDTVEPVFPRCVGGKQATVCAFWVKETEVTNLEYRQFLNDLLKKGDTVSWKMAYPDTAAINRNLWTGRYLDYFSHPYFQDYPVLGVSVKQAYQYCAWQTEKHHLRKNSGEEEFRIPTSLEWELAARGGKVCQPYPWGGPYTRNAKGNELAHFKREDLSPAGKTDLKKIWQFREDLIPQLDSYMRVTDTLMKRRSKIYPGSIPALAASYYPNAFGVFGMAGNAAEMIILPLDSASQTREFALTGGSYCQGPAAMNLNMHRVRVILPDEKIFYAGFRPVMTYLPKRKMK